MNRAGNRHRLEVPAGVIAGVGAAATALAVDRLVELGFTVSATNARGLLAASFGALVTAGAFAFWMLPVAAQLSAASVPSPAVAERLHDRFQRRVVATTLGGLSYTAVTILALPASVDAPAPPIATILGGIVGVAAIAALLVAIQHAVRSTRPTAVLSEAAEKVMGLIRDQGQRTGQSVPHGREGTGAGDGMPVMAPATGWLAAVDEAALLADLPEHSTAVLEVRVGSFVVRGWTRIATVYTSGPETGSIGELGRHLSIHGERSADRDLVGSITQFTDIAVHAATGASGAPSIVYEAVWYLGAILHELVDYDASGVDRRSADGRTLERTSPPEAPALAAMVIGRIRQETAWHPAMALELVRVIIDARRHAAEEGRGALVDALDEQADLAVAQCRHANPLPDDLDRVVAARDAVTGGDGTERKDEYPTDADDAGDSAA